MQSGAGRHTTHWIFFQHYSCVFELRAQHWACMGMETDKGCFSHGLSFLSLGRLDPLPCRSKGAEINTVVYLRDDTEGQVHEAT